MLDSPFLSHPSLRLFPLPPAEGFALPTSSHPPKTSENAPLPLHPFFVDLLGGATPSFASASSALQEDLPWLAALAQTPQDPEWHAEGDVAQHTSMVLDALYHRLSWENEPLPPWSYLALVTAALLHDIAKPWTTVQKDFGGTLRWVAPQHAKRGASWLAYRLLDLGLPLGVCLEILSLVAHHHDPRKFVKRDAPIGSWRRLARQVSMQGLYRLENADLTGRRCTDQKDEIERNEIFRLFCHEYGLWDGRPEEAAFLLSASQAMQGLPLASLEKSLFEGLWAWDEGLIYSPEEAVARSFEGRQKTAEILVTFGLSGSGKSHWVERHCDGAEIIALDHLRETLAGDAEDQSQNARVLGAAREALKEGLRRGRRLVWDATNLRRDFRQAVLQTARSYGAHTTLAVFCTPPSIAAARDKARDRSVGSAILRRQLSGLEWPDLHEAHRILYLDHKGDTLADTRLRWQGLLATAR